MCLRSFKDGLGGGLGEFCSMLMYHDHVIYVNQCGIRLIEGREKYEGFES